MKRAFFIIVALIICISCKCQPKTSIYTAHLRADNSLVTFHDSSTLQEKIPLTIQKFVEKQILKFKDSTYENTFLLYKSNYNRSVDIYALKIYHQFSILYIVFAYHSETGSLTQNPIVLNGKWMENNEDGFKEKLMDGTFLKYIDIDNDNNQELIFRERLHNGTFYNAVQEKYYKLLPNMSFHLLFCNESVAVTFDDLIIHRTLKNNLIHTTIKSENDDMEIGTIILDPTTGVLKNKQIYLEQYKDILITSGNTPEDEFFKKGHPFFY